MRCRAYRWPLRAGEEEPGQHGEHGEHGGAAARGTWEMLADLLLIAVRAAHLLAAAAWVGGALAYAVGGPPASGAGRRAFSRLVGICIWVLIVSGAILTVDRLANARASSLYVTLLALKILLAVGMFLIARLLAPPSSRRRPAPAGAPAPPTGWRLWLTPPYLLLVMGVAIYAIGAGLAIVYVRSIATPAVPPG